LAILSAKDYLFSGSDTFMHNIVTVELTRDCQAIQIPQGATVILPKGLGVDITQTLGGSFTIHAQGGLYRVAERDADALGMESKPRLEENGPVTPQGQPTDLDEKKVWDTLRTCYDPEIPVNIVDLGLVYDLHMEKLPSGTSRVHVKMTLTAPGCGMGPTIARDAQEKILYLDGVEDAQVEIVWDPPWHQSMITEAGRKILGLE
jgi:probable FeS assembly SUF system protein SufT